MPGREFIRTNFSTMLSCYDVPTSLNIHLSVILCVLLEQSVLRNRSHRFILSLSVADLSLSLFVMIPHLVSQPGHWWLGETLCKVSTIIHLFRVSLCQFIGRKWLVNCCKSPETRTNRHWIFCLFQSITNSPHSIFPPSSTNADSLNFY